MYDYLPRFRFKKELPPADAVESALQRATDDSPNAEAKKQVSESFRAVMREIIARALMQGHEMDAIEAIRCFNRSHTPQRPESYYVQNKLQWISHKCVHKIEQDWTLIICLLRPLRERISQEHYLKLVTMSLRNHTMEGSRANSQPRICKRKARKCSQRLTTMGLIKCHTTMGLNVVLKDALLLS